MRSTWSLYRVSKFLADWGSLEDEAGERRMVDEALIRSAVYEGIEKRVKMKAGAVDYFMRWNSTTSPCPSISTVIGVPSLAPFSEDLPRSAG